MAIYYLLDVGHAAVAELYGVPVENFPQFVARWERSFNEADERSSDVGFDAFVMFLFYSAPSLQVEHCLGFAGEHLTE